MKTKIFNVGDIVKATTEIVGRDGMSRLDVGEFARISSAWQNEKYQVVSVEIAGMLPIKDIVCFDSESPLRHTGNLEVDNGNNR